MEKYLTLSVTLKKINENNKLITCKLKLINSCRFMSTSLWNLTNNLTEISKSERKKCKEDSKCINCKNNVLLYRYKKCNDKSYKSIETLKEKFSSTYQFCNKDNNKFLLLSRKGVYPYECMDIWETFNETELPPKISFYSELNLEDITNKDYKHAPKVWDTFNIENLGNYLDLYVQSDTLKLADVFEKFQEKCIEIYQVDPAHFVSAPGLAWQACLKKTNVKLELLTDINMLLMFEEGIRGGICQSILKCACANKKYMKNYNKKMPSSYLMYLDANNLYGWAMCKKLPVVNLNGYIRKIIQKTT